MVEEFRLRFGLFRRLFSLLDCLPVLVLGFVRSEGAARVELEKSQAIVCSWRLF